MKRILFSLFLLLAALPLLAQTNPSARLAIVTESADATTAADVLTVEFSSRKSLVLLERNEIEKMYREQALAAGGKDYLKLGQMLGADGLLLLATAQEGTNQFLNVRLVAVKPGVVLVAEKFHWPLANLTDWSSTFAGHLDRFIPKLAVLVKDAIPLSVVNLRSAIGSAEALETERQLKLLAIQRLSREPQFFVLERQQLQLAATEKDLKLDDSAFWNGSYLLDGVVDQNGFSKETVTINARLTPPKGGQPLLLEASGSRTNLAEIINHLAAKVVAALQINSTAKEWNAADEAAQYFQEANWAVRWGVFKEAQAAADSAWALGKRDLACALVRGRAGLMEAEALAVRYQTGHSTLSSGYDADGKPNGPAPSDNQVRQEIKQLSAQHPLMAAVAVSEENSAKSIAYTFADRLPTVESMDCVLHALNLYEEFSRNSPDGEPKVLSRGPGWNDWHNSDWYQLGLDNLVAASKVLQAFCLVPGTQKINPEKLAELRARVRTVAEMISQSPSVRDSYFVGQRIAKRDELVHTMEESPNIFSCMVNWGCVWQEHPEDVVELYRRLLASPVFYYIHDEWWHREPVRPRLVAWSEADQSRIPSVWKNFFGELEQSTNVLWQMEAKALKTVDAASPDLAQAAKQEWWNLVRSHRAELVGNPVELFYLGWKFDSNAETEAMDQEYWLKTVPAAENAAAVAAVIERQKQFLRENQPYDSMKFNRLFEEKDYSVAQAQEILPLILAYKSNLLAQAALADKLQKFHLQSDARSVEFFLQRGVENILHPEPPPKPPVRVAQTSPPPFDRPPTPVKVQEKIVEVPTNIILVKKFLPIPLDGLPGENISGVTITAHHWQEDKLVLDLQYSASAYSFDEKGKWKGTRNPTCLVIAVLDPVTEHWQVIGCPEVDVSNRNHFYHHTTLCRGEVFTSDGGQVRQFDAAKKTWRVLEISDLGNCELFTVNSRLYAATPNLIVEILEGGNGTKILASNRRQPPVSALDAENLGTPVLFAGPTGSLRAAVAKKIAGWDGTDWRTVCPAPSAPLPPAIGDDGVLFSANSWNGPAGIWRLATEGSRVELLLGQGAGQSTGAEISQPAWKLPTGFSLTGVSSASRGADLFLLTDHAKSENVVNEQQHLITGKKVLPQDGYHATLFCFASNFPAPQKIFLKFESEEAVLPVTGERRPAGFQLPNDSSAWLCFSKNYLFCARETGGAFPGGAGSDPSIRQPQAGIWLVALDEIDAEISRQKNAQQVQQAAADAQTGQVAKSLREKYDLNHNGSIDPDEREPALDDAAFVQSELNLIDTNHNGWLEVGELVYFDANQNKILEPKEAAGIGIAQRLLAEKLLKEFDHSGTGGLNRQDFSGMIESTLHVNPNGRQDLRFEEQDNNHDQRINQEELEFFLQQRTQSGLRARGLSGSPFTRMGMGGRMEPDRERLMKASPEQLFKASVESYWQNPDGTNGRRPFEP